MKNIGKYILIGLGVVLVEWIFLAFFSVMFNGLSQEGAVAVGSAFFFPKLGNKATFIKFLRYLSSAKAVETIVL